MPRSRTPAATAVATGCPSPSGSSSLPINSRCWNSPSTRRTRCATWPTLTRPAVGVVTTVSQAHIQTLGSIEAIEREKGSLIEALPRDGLALLNRDDPRVWRMRERTQAQIVSFRPPPERRLSGARDTLHASRSDLSHSSFPTTDKAGLDAEHPHGVLAAVGAAPRLCRVGRDCRWTRPRRALGRDSGRPQPARSPARPAAPHSGPQRGSPARRQL